MNFQSPLIIQDKICLKQWNLMCVKLKQANKIDINKNLIIKNNNKCLIVSEERPKQKMETK